MQLTSPLKLAMAATVVGIFLPIGSNAQFAQYTQPGGPDPVVTSRQEEMEGAIEESRWRFGGLRVDPWIGLRNVGYVDQGEGDAELSGSGGLGLRAYLPTGPKVIWAAYALPEYAWFEDSSEKSRVNGRYGVGFFGFFNRLSVEALATRAEELDIVSPEIQQRVNAGRDAIELVAELRLASSINLFAQARSSSAENLLEEAERLDPGTAPFDLLNRDEEILRLGVRYRTRDDWLLGLGVEESKAEFDDPTLDRSNSGTSPYFEITIPANRFLVSGDVVFRDLERDGPSSQFAEFRGVSGNLTLVLGNERSRISPAFYARRQLAYTVAQVGSSYLVDERFGLRAGFPLGRRLRLTGFAETGTNDYESPEGLTRNDDVTAYGGDLGIQLGSRLSISVGYSSQDYESNLPGLDRTIDALRAGITLRGFEAGRAGEAW
jgi:hypothetical protein